MPVPELTRTDARRIAVRAALLDAHRPVELVELIGSLGMLRIELTAVVEPSAEHILWSRLGRDFRSPDIDDAVAAGRLFERGWMLRPMSDLGLYLAGMRSWLDRAGARTWVEANDAFARGILERIELDGPLTSRELPDAAEIPWPSSGWSNNRNVTKMLECLHMSGQLAVVGREGRLRVWDLAERVYPAVAEVPAGEARRIRSERLLAACGIMRDSIAVSPLELHGNDRVGESVTIAGVPGRWLVDPSQLDRSFEGRTAILSPFDRLMTDPQRVARVFQFDYTLELYQRAETRRWGQFALPILHGDRLVGKVDARSDRDSGRFVVHRVHEDEPFDHATRAAVDEELDGFASWLGLTLARD
ncbi:MAG TPA: crosslink repair DNA glycosylase YcaQ family protein [Galbitalea sp.]|jgi:hypothetical protein|nr:crosslink repair DNA glycosylase YcaQ family protein [Galbitalea sp.]